MTNITLNQGQKAAADAFLTFLLTDALTFAISGTAGTGKTFLMSYLANTAMKSYEDMCSIIGERPRYTEVAFTATTNKAAEVLETSLNKPVQTIHAFLNLKVKDNYKTGKQDLIRKDSWKIHRNKILFIDESSMIDQVLYKELLEATDNCKIVFVGDHAQMAPVGEELSEVYRQVKPEFMVTLTEPVRNAGQPALVALCQQLRDTVESGYFRPIQEVPGVIDYLSPEDMEAGLHHYFQELNPSCRMLCYTNTRVQDYNDFIRQDVRGLEPGFHPGDIVVVGQAFAQGKTMLNVERELQIMGVGEVEINRSFMSVLGEEIPYRQIEIGTVGSTEPWASVPVAVDQERVMLLTKRLAKMRNWGDYFDLKASFADLRDKAACTVYKSQGSTYDSVFVDIGNIGTSYEAQQVARMLFVAISRARHRVFLFGALPYRYINTKGDPLWTPEKLSTTLPITSSIIEPNPSTLSVTV